MTVKVPFGPVPNVNVPSYSVPFHEPVMVPVPDTMSAEYLRVAAGATYLGSNAKARRELGFDPRPIEEGLRQTLEYEQAALRGAPLPAVS